MSLFQKTVEQKYLKQLDSKLIETKYNEFKSYFGNPDVQENIRNSKEEQFQEGFLRELFVKILGYTLNPSPNFNLTTEYKNIKDSKKADGAIIIGESVKGVIELKGTDTTDLSKVETQAFGYKNNQTDCVYIVTSNFEKLRIYIDNAIEHIEFNLFTLSKKEFEILYLSLAFESVEKGIPKRIKDESVSQEDKITKELYRDYSLFKKELYQNLVTINPQIDSLTLYKKSQKLLDRFLFLFFAEDRNLLPPNSVRLVLNDWKELIERDEVKPLYDRFKKYFEYLNTGYKGKRYDVFAYNGGLFKPDEILDRVIIDDDLLYKHTLKLSEYDFASEVDVNILGHIFENSLNELDEITALHHNRRVNPSVAVSSVTVSSVTIPSVTIPSVSKRKKDGVFYTPKYITKYIVENTIGKLCQEKKAELLISEEDYTTDRKRQLKTKALLVEKLKVYREWLLQLTICDPACGSGAFLNQALDFLISEHRYIDELQAKLFGDSLILSDIEKSILENNLFGVDLNEESVEIAKLSLWLRTAQPNRKLNDLNNNIKCGNSLIDDPAIAGVKAFNWQKEFPKIFQEKHKKAFHITFVLHNSRYATAKGAITDGLTRRLSSRSEPGFIARTFPEFTEQEQEIVAEELAKAAKEYNLNILECNVCNDHVHSILVCEEEELSTLVGKWKGRTAFEYNRRKNSRELLNRQEDNNRRVNPSVAYPLGEYPSVASPSVEKRKPNYADGTIEKLWAKSFYPKEITDEQQMQNTIRYIRNNRHKHGLPPSTDGLTRWLKEMTCTHNHAYRTEYTGGFDVVIGNPPYVQLQSMGEMSDMLKNCGYVTYDKGADLYCIFTERGYGLLKFGGIQSFIMPNKWMLVAYGKPLRKFLSKTGLHQVLNFGDVQFFQEATTYICIFVTQKSAPKDNVEVLSLNQKTYHGDFLTEVKKNLYDYPASRFGESEWSIQPYNDSRKLEQMKLNGIELKDLPININYGIKTGFNDAFFIDDVTRKHLIDADAKSDELIKPMVRGRNISAYGNSDSEFLIIVHNGIKEKNPPLPPIIIDNYSAIKKHLDVFYNMLEKRGDKGDTPYNLRNCAYLEEFAKPKIIYPNMTSTFPFMYDESGFFSNDKSFIITAQDDTVSLLFLTAVFNSSLAKLWIWYNCPELQGGAREIRKVYFEHFPVPQANEEQTATLILFATERTQLTTDLQTLISKFQRTIQRKFFQNPSTDGFTRRLNPQQQAQLSNKLQDWYLLSYSDFISELGKKKVKLSLSDEAEWEAYFLQESKKALELKAEIETTDKEIDQMVYKLYDLTEDEIRIVETI